MMSYIAQAATALILLINTWITMRASGRSRAALIQGAVGQALSQVRNMIINGQVPHSGPETVFWGIVDTVINAAKEGIALTPAEKDVAAQQLQTTLSHLVPK